MIINYLFMLYILHFSFQMMWLKKYIIIIAHPLINTCKFCINIKKLNNIRLAKDFLFYFWTLLAFGCNFLCNFKNSTFKFAKQFKNEYYVFQTNSRKYYFI